MKAHIFGTGVAATIPKESGDGIIPARFQCFTENVCARVHFEVRHVGSGLELTIKVLGIGCC
jgi:hypothetical protein